MKINLWLQEIQEEGERPRFNSGMSFKEALANASASTELLFLFSEAADKRGDSETANKLYAAAFGS